MKRVHRRIVAALRAGRSGPSLVEASEAFLSGSYGTMLDRGGHARPAWTWLNTLAHAEAERLGHLAGLAGEDAGLSGGHTPWDQATSLLAFEIMQAVGEDPVALVQVQHDVLMPLEAAWMAGDSPPDSPRQLVRRVIAALTSRRRSRPDPATRAGTGRQPTIGHPSSTTLRTSQPTGRMSRSADGRGGSAAGLQPS